MAVPHKSTPKAISEKRNTVGIVLGTMRGAARRAFQAERTVKYCHGSARFAETGLGWSREAGEGGVAEHRRGIVGVDAHSAGSGRKRWEEK